MLLTESTGEAFAGPSSAAQLKCLRKKTHEQDGSHSPRTRSIIRTKEENCIKNLSQGSEGTGESISGLNSSSSCYDLSGSERWNETPIIIFEASFSFLDGLIHTHTQTAATIKLRNEIGTIRTSAHPKAEKTEEQHHKARHAHTLLLPVLRWLLFDLWGFST